MFVGCFGLGVLVAFACDAQDRFMRDLLVLSPGSQNGGIYANKSGYHNTRDNHLASRPNDYSIRDAVDREGPGDKAAAYDWTFPDAQSGRFETIARFMSRIVASGRDVDDPRLNGWREFYGQADGDREVEGWDSRYLVPVTSDSSHLWHIHMSESRSFTESYDNKSALLSVLRGETVDEWRNGGGVDMATVDEAVSKLQYEDKAWGASLEPDDGVNTQSNQNRWSVAAEASRRSLENTEKILGQIGVGGTDPEVLRTVVREELVKVFKAYAQGGLDGLK